MARFPWANSRPPLTWHNGWRAGAALIALLFLSTHAPPPPGGTWRVGPERMATVYAVPVPMRTDNDDTRLGSLRYLGGWHLTSSDFGFGGISSMHVADGAVTALSDVGILYRFRVPRWPADRGPMLITPLRQIPGRADVKAERDSEAMIISGGQAWVGFEVRNQIWRYDTATWTAQAHTTPEGISRWPAGRGPESMIRLAPNRFLVLSEQSQEATGSGPALLFLGDPAEPGTRTVNLRYRAPAGFRPTDATLLPDGRLLILNRTFSFSEGFTSVLTVARLPDIAPEALIEGQEIARFEAPVTLDNFEALSVTQEDGRTIIWIASDDNFLSFQRTLLLKFALEG